MLKQAIILSILITFLTLYASAQINPPRFTCIIVIDQLHYHVLKKLQPSLRGGIKFLLENGYVFDQAYWPHARPATATGHTALVTGCFASQHGITDNYWIDQNGKKIKADDDDHINARVFKNEKELYEFGKSAHHIMADTLSDQFILTNTLNKVFSLSVKSRAAIMMAGHCGKAIWFEKEYNHFTSSKTYFNTLPSWITSFNRQFLRMKPNNKESLLSPSFVKKIFDLALLCLDNEWKKEEQLILFISISAPDQIAHIFGNTSSEYINMIRYIDIQLNEFFNQIANRVSKEDTLFVLTADHAGMDIPEKLNAQGLTLVRRIHVNDIANSINTYIKKRYNIDELVTSINTPHIYFNHALFDAQPKQMQRKMVKKIKQLLSTMPGIKEVWTAQELLNKSLYGKQFEYWYQEQLFKGRHGDLIFHVFPYTYVSKHTQGSGHETPYAYDTHVPLIFYRPGSIEKEILSHQVFVPQVASTIAHILEIPKPSAAKFNCLIFN